MLNLMIRPVFAQVRQPGGGQGGQEERSAASAVANSTGLSAAHEHILPAL